MKLSSRLREGKQLCKYYFMFELRVVCLSFVLFESRLIYRQTIMLIKRADRVKSYGECLVELVLKLYIITIQEISHSVLISLTSS